MDLAEDWLGRLRAETDGYARLALENIGQEFPSLVAMLMTGPGQFPDRPRDRTPVFFGSLDWHSCVEMHWVLVRLLKTAPGAVPADEIRAALGDHGDWPLRSQDMLKERPFITRLREFNIAMPAFCKELSNIPAEIGRAHV